MSTTTITPASILRGGSFWNWMLDWQDITKAPVWEWFGGNGNSSLDKSIQDGYCVDSGPFADLQLLYYRGGRFRHCLSRDFESAHTVANLGRNLRPHAIDKLMNIPEYDTFNQALEEKMHNVLPRVVRGDFSLFTAPNGTVSPYLR